MKQSPVRKISNYNRVKKDKTNYSRPEGAGNYDNMDDMGFSKSINTQQGSVQHTPTRDKDLVNKKYSDDQDDLARS